MNPWSSRLLPNGECRWLELFQWRIFRSPQLSVDFLLFWKRLHRALKVLIGSIWHRGRSILVGLVGLWSGFWRTQLCLESKRHSLGRIGFWCRRNYLVRWIFHKRSLLHGLGRALVPHPKPWFFEWSQRAWLPSLRRKCAQQLRDQVSPLTWGRRYRL